ncbi:hypothetical protein TNCV_3196811 [Trichonephila clavipes]|nr:hypothetical protein TNCV_3196811 [Trichonephila clavipes]
MALDVWKEVSGVESMLFCDVVGEMAALLIARSSRSFVFWPSDPPRRYTLPSVIPVAQHRATTISLRPGGSRYVGQPYCFSRGYYTA